MCPLCHDALGSVQHVLWECRVTNVEQLRPHDASVELTEDIAEEAKGLERKASLERLQQRRARLRSSTTETFRWLRGKKMWPKHITYVMMNVTTMMKLVLAPVNLLKKIHSYWSSIWQRVDDRETCTMQEYMQQNQVQPKPQRKSEPVATPLFYQCAIKQKGKAGSIDGWSGSEVSVWPFDMWESIAPSFVGRSQTHLPKQGR